MPIKKDREYRNMTVRAVDGPEDEKKIVSGYASTFDEPYILVRGDGWVYYEVVDAGAFDETDMTDVIMQYDHAGRVFARTKNNTLEVSPDEHGLAVRADLGGTEIGRELFEEIRGGYTDKMSFGFTVNGETEEKTTGDDGATVYTRHITSVGKLYDVSAVSIPANDGTSINADAVTRSIGDLTNGLIERIEAERLAEKEAELMRKRAEVRAKALGGITE